MKKPVLTIIEEIENIKANRKEILKESGYETIYQVKKELGFKTADDAYNYLFYQYNAQVKQFNIESQRNYEKKFAEYSKFKYEKDLKDAKKKKGDKKKEKNAVKSFLLKNQVPKQDGYNNMGTDDTTTGLRNALKKKIGKNVVVVYMINGVIVKERNYFVPTQFTKWFDSIRNEWVEGGVSDAITLFTYYERGFNEDYLDIWGGTEENPNKIDLSKCKLFVYEETPLITSSKIIQAFKDGITNCLLTPIRVWAQETLEECKSQSAKYRYEKIIKDINVFEEMYKDGVPENAISDICNKLQVDISVQMPYCETKFIECQSIKKRLKHFNFLNTRINHVDLNEITNLGNYIESSRQEIKNIIKEYGANGTFCYYNRDKTCVYTLQNIYKVVDEYNEVVNEFEIEYNMGEYVIDDITQPELSAFIKEGTHYNSTVDFVGREELLQSTNHYDMEKAYANFKKCSFYTKFLGKITDFRKCNKIEGVGLYKISNLNFDGADSKFVAYNNKMQIYFNDCVYPSPELNMLLSYGVRFEIIAGCWGVESFDFEFNNDMLHNKTEDGISYYAKWCGQIDSHKLTKDLWFKGDYNMAGLLRDNYGDGIVRWYENEEICVSYPKKHNFHKGHITAFITSYQRISVIEQLMEIDINNVKRICVDGIYFCNNEVVCKNVFRSKTDMKFGNEAGESYISNNEGNPINDFADYREHNAKELWIGAGGNGKTHTNLTDKGLIKVLYISPSWKLARNKQTEYKWKTVQVWANILTVDPEQQSKIRKNNCLLIDEVSMMTEEQKEFIFKTYPNMKLIFCGDLGFQLPCVVGEEMNNTGFDKIIKLDVNYRCKDKRLLTILDTLREMISLDRPKSEINNYVISEFKKLGRYITIDDLKNKYAIDDMVLTGTNCFKDYLTGLFAGKFEKEKYYITSNNRLYSNGEIVIGEKPEIKCDVRHAFTTHSIQGETAYHKLFIESSKMFDSRMFYTALSRAKRLDQIYIIEPNADMKGLKNKQKEEQKKKEEEENELKKQKKQKQYNALSAEKKIWIEKIKRYRILKKWNDNIDLESLEKKEKIEYAELTKFVEELSEKSTKDYIAILKLC
jgi:hypothetical protein